MISFDSFEMAKRSPNEVSPKPSTLNRAATFSRVSGDRDKHGGFRDAYRRHRAFHPFACIEGATPIGYVLYT
jgi:hypothetical protein